MIMNRCYSTHLAPTGAYLPPTFISPASGVDLCDWQGDQVSLGQEQASEVSLKDLRKLFQPVVQFEQTGGLRVTNQPDKKGVEGSIKQQGELGVTFTDPTGTYRNTSSATYNNSAGAGVEIDLKNGSGRAHFEQSGEVAIGYDQSLNLSDDVSLKRKQKLSLGEEVKGDFSVKHKLNGEGLDAGYNLDLGAKAELKNTTTNGVKLGGNSLEWESEQKVFADAHAKAKNELVVNRNEVRVGAGFDVGAEAGVGDKETIRAKSSNGSSFELSGDGNLGAGASAKGGFSFARTNSDKDAKGGGSTEVGFSLGGKFMAGAGVDLKVKIADSDIDTAVKVANPLLYAVGGADVLKTGLKAIPKVLGTAAETVGSKVA